MSNHQPSLQYHNNQLLLRWQENNKAQFMGVDFLSKASQYRRYRGGGRKQLIARAVGLKGKDCPSVLDCTAGLGEDAFVLACLGCNVTMIERSPIIAALLEDGIQRAKQDPSCHDLQLQLIIEDAMVYLGVLAATNYPDVIYLDPMFPSRKKSALVKKEMRMLRKMVGDDQDAPSLLAIALQRAKKRVVVKRPRLAPSLSERQPHVVLKGQSSRFDIYLPAGNCI